MTSKVQKAKEDQRYSDKPMVCCNCGHYASEKITHEAAFSWSTPYVREKNKRCTVGGFAVKSNGTCELHVLKESSNAELCGGTSATNAQLGR